MHTRAPAETAVSDAYVIICLVQGDWERALDLIDEMGDAPEYAPHLVATASRLLVANDGAAVRVAARAVEMDPHSAPALSILGRALLAVGDLQPGSAARIREESSNLRAETALRRAVELDSQDLATLTALGDLYTRQQQLVEARVVVEQALSLDPRDDTAREALKRLRKAVEAALKAMERGEAGRVERRGSPPGPAADRQSLTDLLRDLRRISAELHQTSRSTAPPRVSLCLITRDEARNLPRVIESVRGLATEIIVVDTGSTDETVKIAQRLGARVESYEWNDDFAAARNHSLGLATGEWILVLDADDELIRDTVHSLRQWLSQAPGAKVVGLYRRYPHPGMQRDSVSIQPRLFRNGRGLHFQGAIHEELVTTDGRLAPPEITLTATIYHHGAIERPGATARRRERNERILLRVLEREPDDLRSRFYLGLTQFEAERWSDAIPALQLVVTQAGDDLDFLPKAYAGLGNALLKAHRPLEAEETLRAGLARLPLHPELWFCLGLVCDHLGRLEEAIAANENALRGRFGPSLNWHDWACREAKPHLALCDLKLTLGDPREAARHLAAAERFTGPRPAYAQIQEAIVKTEEERDRLVADRQQALSEQEARFASGDAEAGYQVVDLLLAAGRSAEARAFLDAWLARAPDDPRGLIAGGRVHLACGAVEEALRCFSSARQACSELIPAWLGEAAALRALNQGDEAERALLGALEHAPECDAVNHALGAHYLERERWEAATGAFQRSLDHRDENGAAWLGLGQSLLRTGNLPAAINCYQRAASLSGGGAAVRIALGEARALLARQSARECALTRTG